MSTDIVGSIGGTAGVLLGIALGAVGIWYGRLGVIESRRQRSKRHQSDLIIANLIGRLNGAMVMIKTIVPDERRVMDAVNDSLSAINVAQARIDGIENSGDGS